MIENKVSRHPDKEEIIKKLLNGDSVKQVEAWIKSKYPKNKKYHISYMSLQNFRTNNLNIRGDLLEDIKNRRKQNQDELELQETKLVVSNSSEYQKKLDEIVSNEIDVNRKLLEMEKLISSRLEFYFNAIMAGGSTKHDKVFLEYLNAMRAIMQDWKKYVEGFADKKVEHNINVQVVDTQVKVMKEAIYDVLREMDPALILIFMEKLNKRMQQLNYDSPEYNNYLIDVNGEEV
jgi:hypothetical protein